MGGGESKIVNVNGTLIQAGIVDIKNECEYVKCSPNISQFCNYDKKRNNLILNKNIYIYLIFLLLFLMFIFIYIWFIIKHSKK